MKIERMQRLRRLSVVPRWTVIPTVRRQNVAEHSFHVAWLSLHVAGRSGALVLGKVSREDLLIACLIHDESEALSGDMSAPFKSGDIGSAIKAFERRHDLGLNEAGDVKQILKVADLLEAALFIHEEQEMGNLTLDQIARDVIANLQKAWASLEWHTVTPKPDCLDFMQRLLADLSPSRHPVMHSILDIKAGT